MYEVLVSITGSEPIGTLLAKIPAFFPDSCAIISNSGFSLAGNLVGPLIRIKFS